jgi:beta-N-acetylhexosaminidase
LAGLSARRRVRRALRPRPGAGLTAARLSARLIAADLIDLGITVDCLPLADVPVAGADAVIGNRAYGTEPGKVAAIARAVTEGLEQGGVCRC